MAWTIYHVYCKTKYLLIILLFELFQRNTKYIMNNNTFYRYTFSWLLFELVCAIDIGNFTVLFYWKTWNISLTSKCSNASSSYKKKAKKIVRFDSILIFHRCHISPSIIFNLLIVYHAIIGMVCQKQFTSVDKIKSSSSLAPCLLNLFYVQLNKSMNM